MWDKGGRNIKLDQAQLLIWALSVKKGVKNLSECVVEASLNRWPIERSWICLIALAWMKGF